MATSRKDTDRKSDENPTIAQNQRARYEYFIEDRLEAGLALQEQAFALVKIDVRCQCHKVGREQFAQRADVKKAIRRVGRVDSYPLYTE